MLLYDVLQQGLPLNVMPHWIEIKGRMRIVSLQPRYPTMHFSAFRISNSEECLIVKDWSKIVNDRREVLGGSNQKRNRRLGDRFIYMLQYDNQESYTCSMLFYLRESSRSDQLVHALSTCPLMSVFFVLNLISKCDLLLWCYERL